MSELLEDLEKENEGLRGENRELRAEVEGLRDEIAGLEKEVSELSEVEPKDPEAEAIVEDLRLAQWRFERGYMDDFNVLMGRIFNDMGGARRY